ncbi:putative disease resistance protein [Senna tora]|uniref:Putative disease resistance protein n=1 Tax=Senna tora TaxID=362788 RepID=A0A834T417_9FABA|nr:putative disease resistance protein [Senna tora]
MNRAISSVLHLLPRIISSSIPAKQFLESDRPQREKLGIAIVVVVVKLEKENLAKLGYWGQMTEIIVSIVAKFSEYLVPLTIRQGQYLFCGHKITKCLEKEKKALASTRDSVQRRIEDASHRAEKVTDAVLGWLNDVKELIEEVELLEQEIEAHSSSCFRGKCPNRKRYSLCKKMEKKTKAMIQLNQKSEFEPFSQPAPIPDIEYFSSENFEYFQSTILAAGQLLEALQDDSGYIIGLYGMGGSGKTTLVKEVGKKAKELRHFDRVLFATVSHSPNIMKIQDEIAELLDLILDERSEAGRARRISMRLQSGERILIILDDVWAKLNLEEIGIPVDGNQKGCKVLLTTRRQDVCDLMDCPKRIPLNLLSEGEAWSLFRKHASIDEDALSSSNPLNDVQRKVCKECKGLPIAIVAVGSSLKGKSSAVDEWKVALQSLRDSKPMDVDEGVRDAFNCLKLSYEYLKSKEAKLLFLICSMFPEDHEILIDDLFKYGVALGICGECFDLARNRLRVCINKLVNSCLLMPCETSQVDLVFRRKNDRVKMHDMVRDVALWIASKDHPIMVNLAKDLNASIDNGAIKDCFALSSWNNNGIDKFPHGLDAPKLQILLLNLFGHRTPLRLTGPCELLEASFQGMKTLKVVALINKYIYQKVAISFPQSLQLLTNLRTLRLVGWDLGDISFVVSLKRLEILDLQESKFKQLPNGIENLNKLKLLDLSLCRIEESCLKIIRRCSQLEELYAFNYGDSSSLGITGPYECFEDDITSPSLQSYKLCIGPFMSHPSKMHSLTTRLLYINGFNPSASDVFVKYLLRRAQDVLLYNLHGGYRNIFPDTVQAVGCMNELTNLQLKNCSEMECLIDVTSSSADQFPIDATPPSLVELHLEHMDNLKQLWCGPLLHCFFEKLQVLKMAYCIQLRSIFPRQCNLQNLKRLSLSKCRTLTSLFPMSVAGTLVKLEYLSITECSELRHIINNEQKDGTDTGEVIVNVPDNFRVILPELKELTISSCGKLEFILPISCVEGLVHLRKIRISDVFKLKYVFGQNDHEDQLSYLSRTKLVPPLRCLEEVELESLPNLLSIFSENYHLSWECLRKLVWRNCPKLSTNSSYSMDFASEDRELPPNLGVHLGKECLISKLEYLSLLKVHELRFIWTDSTLTQTLSLRYLRYLSVTNCRNLKSIFSVVIQRSLPELLELYVGNCEELEEIIAENEEDDNVSTAQVCFPKLTRIEVRRCNKLKSLFSTAIARMLPQLSILTIIDAPQLKEIFRRSSKEGANDEELLMLPNLKEIRLEELKSLVDVGLDTRGLRKVISECPSIRSGTIDSA